VGHVDGAFGFARLGAVASLFQRVEVDHAARHQLLDQRIEAGVGLDLVALALHRHHVNEAQRVVEIAPDRVGGLRSEVVLVVGHGTSV
jgi:hypothetical protein